MVGDKVEFEGGEVVLMLNDEDIELAFNIGIESSVLDDLDGMKLALRWCSSRVDGIIEDRSRPLFLRIL